MRSKHILIVLSVIAALTAVAVVVSAGDPDNPPGPPETTSSYTLEHIYDRLDTGAAGAQITFTEPISGPTVGTGHTLDEIMAIAPQVDDTNGATASQVVSEMTYWGLRNGAWGLQSGTATAGGNVTGGDGQLTFTIPDGFYTGSKTATAQDADLVAGNIKGGVSVFDVDGTLYSPVPKTGQTTSYATGDDGDLEVGVAWPTPRFTDNSDGTVTDNLTGLIWLKNANCWGKQNWATSIVSANALSSGECGLGDGSSAGDWRLPNVRELQSLIDYGKYNPALPDGHPFTGVQPTHYWSSTTHAFSWSLAWNVNLNDGYVDIDSKTDTDYVWPVRGGQ